MERRRQRTVLAAVTTAEFLTTFMASSVMVALRAIDEQWHVSTDILSWLSLGYVLGVAALLMPAGKLADLTGRKRFFIIGMSAFATIASSRPSLPRQPHWSGFGFCLAQAQRCYTHASRPS